MKRHFANDKASIDGAKDLHGGLAQGSYKFSGRVQTHTARYKAVV